jgi:hypothetical protein
LRIQPPNVSLLKKIAVQTGGRFGASIGQMIHPAGATVVDYRSIDNLLIPLAIFMLLAEVFVRRRLLGE